MKRFIIESDDDRLTGDLIVELLENEVDLSAKVKKVELIDEDKLEKMAEDCADKFEMEPTQRNVNDNGWEYGHTYKQLVECYKTGYRKYESEII